MNSRIIEPGEPNKAASGRSDAPIYVLGMDGGGTKTEAVLSVASMKDDSVEPIASFCSGPSNLQQQPIDLALTEMKLAFEGLLLQVPEARGRLAACCFAVAGSGNEALRKQLIDWIDQQGWTKRNVVTHDARIVIAAGTTNDSGVALISGTGSIAYARTLDGREARCGGWRSLIGDEGSAYWLAIEGFRHALHAWDDRGPKTSLVEAFSEWLDGIRPPEWPLQLAAWQRQRIAAAAKVVTAAASRQDPVAMTIVANAACELSIMVETLCNKLFMNQPVEIAMAGGLLCDCHLLRSMVLDQLAERRIEVRSTQLVRNPVDGACRIAAQLGQSNHA